MRNALGWSYSLLGAAEQAIFRRCAVFGGGFALAAADAVCACAALDHDILDGLTTLVEASMLRVEEQGTTEGHEPRFVMLDTIREFGLERLVESAEEDAARQAHAEWFLRLAEEAEPALRGAGQRRWLAQLDRERDNIRTVFHWAQERGEVAIGLSIATALWRFWSTRGLYSEARSWMEALLALDERAASPAPPLLRARALNQAARLADRQGELERAVTLSQASLALYRAAGDRVGTAASLSTLGGALKEQGEYKNAMPLLEESLALRRELGDRAHIASALNSLGGVARWQGQYDRAEASFQEALAMYTEAGDSAAIAHMLFRLGDVRLDRRDFFGARRLYEESLALRGDLEDKEGIGFVLNSLALVAHAAGNYDRAIELVEHSVRLFREIGAKRQVSCMLDTLARIVLDQGDLERAARAYADCLTLALAAGAQELVPYGLEGLGRVAAHRGQPERGAKLFGAGSAIRDSINTPPAGHEQAVYEQAVREIQEALGGQAFSAAWAEGRAMSMENAAAYALQDYAPDEVWDKLREHGQPLDLRAAVAFALQVCE
jgi:tetratricopeptide (TPR) repeat protein